MGSHPRADVIRKLDVDPNPIFAAYIPDVHGLLDDVFECWFVTPETEPAQPIGEGLEAVYSLGYSQDWLPPPKRDPNFNLIHDDIRLVYGMNVPASYTVQGRRNPVKDRYLRSLDVNTIWIDGWNQMPDFLTRINPAVPPPE